MTVAVLGPGAVGGVLAAGFVEGGVDVICVARPATAASIRSWGLTLKWAESVKTVRPRVETELREPVELLLVTVKAPALEDALERVQAAAEAVVPLLNGIEHMAVLRERLPESHVAGGSIGRIEAWLEQPGVVIQPTPSVVMTVAADAPAELLGRSGVKVRVNGTAEAVLWEKLARQAPTAAATSITQRPVGELRSDPEWRARLRRAIEEACAVAARDGVTLSAEAEWGIIEAMPPLLTSSTARDIAAGVQSELDAITGAVVARRPARSALRLLFSRRCSKRRAERHRADPGALGLRARPREEHPAARRPPVARVRVATARQAGIFERVVCSTDSGKIAEVAQRYGADVPFLRPAELATSTSPDIEWITHALEQLDEHYDLFAIVRATNPFRGPDVLQRGLQQLLATPEADSIRAVELVKQHPGKMWVVDGRTMRPLLDQSHLDVAWHAGQYQALPEIYVQNSALEIAWTRVVSQTGTREGKVVAPFFTDRHEGFNIDDEDRLGARASATRRG